MAIKFKRGSKVNLPTEAEQAEPLFTTDTKEFFIGNGPGQIPIQFAKELGVVRANPNAKYKIVSCVLRNTGSGWFVLNDDSHTPINVQYAVNDTDSIGIAYSFTAKTMGSIICVPDETFIQDGYSFGASGGVSIADIQISRNKPINGYVYYDNATASWKVLAGGLGITGATFSNGVLTITHEDTDSLDVSVSAKSGTYLAAINNTATSSTEVSIKDYAGALVTVENNNMGIFFSRGSKKVINPNNVVSIGGNIWVLGILEVE